MNTLSLTNITHAIRATMPKHSIRMNDKNDHIQVTKFAIKKYQIWFLSTLFCFPECVQMWKRDRKLSPYPEHSTYLPGDCVVNVFQLEDDVFVIVAKTDLDHNTIEVYRVGEQHIVAKRRTPLLNGDGVANL